MKSRIINSVVESAERQIIDSIVAKLEAIPANVRQKAQHGALKRDFRWLEREAVTGQQSPER